MTRSLTCDGSDMMFGAAHILSSKAVLNRSPSDQEDFRQQQGKIIGTCMLRASTHYFPLP
jgi:hypothetical protein